MGVAGLLLAGCGKKAETSKTGDPTPLADTVAAFEQEGHLANVRQLTFGGQNAEAYFSYDGRELIFQSTRGDLACDAIYRMDIDGSHQRMVSSGEGATTCSFISPDNSHIIYASTHLGGVECPPKPDMSQGYVWALYDSYDIFRAAPNGGSVVRLTDTPGYDAEGVYSPNGHKIIFTSLRTGDLELFMMNPDGSGIEQLTDMPGYDGGAFFSFDDEWIVWRASRPEGDDLANYQRLLKQNLIRPGHLEIYVMNLHDREPIQLTDNGAANFGPYFHPDGKRVIFASNMDDPRGRNFDLYVVDVATKEVERITYNETFDGFPMFSHDGASLVFCSNRYNDKPGETNVFIADWVD
jgi:Tol biopolymer transport system component